MKFSVIIPTYQRPKSLYNCVLSIIQQSRMSDELIIVDDDSLSPDEISKLKDLCSDGTNLIYYKKNHDREPRGSATSRNIGIAKATNNTIFIFDDDLVLEPDFVSSTMTVWEKNKNKNLFAVGGIISNNRVSSKWEKLYHRMGGLGDMDSWNVNTVGFQSWNDGITKNTSGYYAHGGVCSYSKSHLAKLGGFATFQGGRTALEDVEFFLRAKLSGFSTILVPQACARHDHSPLGRENKFKSGHKEGYNRVQIFKQHTPKTAKNILWFLWANISWICRKLFLLQMTYACGMIAGSIASVKSKK